MEGSWKFAQLSLHRPVINSYLLLDIHSKTCILWRNPFLAYPFDLSTWRLSSFWASRDLHFKTVPVISSSFSCRFWRQTRGRAGWFPLARRRSPLRRSATSASSRRSQTRLRKSREDWGRIHTRLQLAVQARCSQQESQLKVRRLPKLFSMLPLHSCHLSSAKRLLSYSVIKSPSRSTRLSVMLLAEEALRCLQ